MKSLEVERKFLLEGSPDLSAVPFRDAVTFEIEQGYLLGSGNVRLRRAAVVASGEVLFYRTAKVFVAPGVSEEDESLLSEDEYFSLVPRLDPRRPQVRKLRRLVPHAGRLFELDEVLAPSPCWVLEVELADPSELALELELPPGVSVRRELTYMRRPRRPEQLVPTPTDVRRRLAQMAAAAR